MKPGRLIALIAFVLAGCGPVRYGSPTATATDTAAASPSPSPTATHTPSETLTGTPSATPTPTETETSTVTPTFTDTPTVFSYVFPVQPLGSVDFSGERGHPYPATDIFAPVGSRFVAVVDGVVDFVSYKDEWVRETDDPETRGGLSVAIVGDDGLRYYGSHLSSIKAGIAPGARVTAGQLLGLTGDSGDAAGTTPHLHFGISHPTYPKDWKTRRGELDPFPYLLAWSRGENLQPRFPTATPYG